jgi:hypothetical protein
MIAMQTTFTNRTTGPSAIGLSIFKFSLLMTLLLPETAHAYIDPGSASLIVSSILGFIAAIGFTFRKYFYKLKQLLIGNKPKDESFDE